jgi:thioredoxin reductase (NADPH)
MLPAPDLADSYDSIVVGGGPAGTSAALNLVRLRRSVLVVDAGDSRALRIPRSHNYPGFPGGVAGSELLSAMRLQAADYPVRFLHGEVTGIDRSGDGFRVRWSGGSAHARTVLIATGASDIEPRMPHLAEAVRDGALRYCPVCDGYEVIDQRVGVLVDGASGLHEALYLRQFTPNLTVFPAHEGVTIDEGDRSQLRDAGIVWQPQAVTALRLHDAHIDVSLGTDIHRKVERFDSVYCALGIHVHSALAKALGAECDAEGYLVKDAHQRTSVRGLFAAGDVAAGLNQISVATGSASIAASAMHLAMGGAHRD